MSKRKVTVVLLCEDVQHETFARRSLVKRAFHERRIRSIVSPRGGRSGEQFVRETYPTELDMLRKGHVAVKLVVVIDGDKTPVAHRKRQLDASCQQKGIAIRKPNEPAAIFVPKRSIETWLHYLDGNSVDEESVYPRLPKPGDCVRHVDGLMEKCQDWPVDDAPPSLADACGELTRIV